MASSSAQKIQNIANAKENIRTSINRKGVRCDSSVPITEFANKIDNIQNFYINGEIASDYLKNLLSSSMRDCQYLFYSAENLTEINAELSSFLTYFNTQEARNCSYMFSSCPNLTKIDDFSLYLPYATTCTYMFGNDSKLENIDELSIYLPISTTFNNMFYSCSKLKDVPYTLFDN